MRSLTEYLTEVAHDGELVNTFFEERLFDLVGVLERIVTTLEAEGIAYQLVGGLAVLVHVEEANPEHSTLTGNVDLMVERTDLDRIRAVATHARFRSTEGVDMLVWGRHTVRLTFGIRGSIAPVRKQILGVDVMVIPGAELVRMKLSSFRAKDRVHVRSMDAAGLISVAVEQSLPTELKDRLRIIRETE